jgi:UDP-N-acetylglucosamine 4-epimerase
LEEFSNYSKFEFIEGDIRNYETCLEACTGIDLISHQAALGSVPRSIKDPLTTNSVNITGFLNIFTVAKEQGIKRIVFAASSSTYGDSKDLPKVEDKIGNPLSPYAVTKLVNEQYAKVYADLYGIEFIGLRYFNIFGPKQDPDGSYAAVIPLFFKAALENKGPYINGDGSYSRDFTYVANAVQANILGLFTENEEAVNQIYNVACGERTTLNELWKNIKETCGTSAEATYRDNRIGDVPHSLADISKIQNLLGYQPKIKVKAGMEHSYQWYKSIY